MKKTIGLIISCLLFGSIAKAGQIVSCKQVLIKREAGLLKLGEVAPFVNTTVINSDEPPFSMKFIEYYDLSFEYPNTGKEFSLIGLTPEGELYHLLKEDAEWSSIATKLSGKNIIKDFKVSTNGKILVTFLNKEGVFVFSSHNFFEEESRLELSGFMGFLASVINKMSFEKAFVKVNVDFNDREWFLSPEITNLSKGNSLFFDTSYLRD